MQQKRGGHAHRSIVFLAAALDSACSFFGPSTIGLGLFPTGLGEQDRTAGWNSNTHKSSMQHAALREETDTRQYSSTSGQAASLFRFPQYTHCPTDAGQ